MNLSTMRALVRRDLHDEDADTYRWSDDELDRHIERAAREASLAAPLESKAVLTTTAGSRDLSLSSLSDRVVVEAVEYPVDRYPPVYAPFSLWGDTLTLLVDSAPVSEEDVRVYYGKLHTIDENGSTLPAALEDVVATGAAGYAALEWASFATNRVNAGGSETWRDYLVWGEQRLAAFSAALARHGHRSAVRVRRLYTPASPMDGQAGDPAELASGTSMRTLNNDLLAAQKIVERRALRAGAGTRAHRRRHASELGAAVQRQRDRLLPRGDYARRRVARARARRSGDEPASHPARGVAGPGQRFRVVVIAGERVVERVDSADERRRQCPALLRRPGRRDDQVEGEQRLRAVVRRPDDGGDGVRRRSAMSLPA